MLGRMMTAVGAVRRTLSAFPQGLCAQGSGLVQLGPICLLSDHVTHLRRLQ